MHYYDLASGTDDATISLGPVVKRVEKCAMIIAPTLILSSTVVLAQEVKNVGEGTKQIADVTKAAKEVSKADKYLRQFRYVGGGYLGSKSCVKGLKKFSEMKTGPISPQTAAAAFIFTFLWGGFAFTYALED